MRVRVHLAAGDIRVNQSFEGATPEAVVHHIQEAVASRASFAIRLVVSALSPLQFAQQAVDQYNRAVNRSIPIPASCDEFLRLAEAERLLTLENEAETTR